MTATPISTTPLGLTNPLFPKACQLFPATKHQTFGRHLAPKISIKAVTNDEEFQSPPEKTNNEGLKYTQLDRRNMLIKLGGLYGAAATLGGSPKIALAKPAVPDVTKCYPTDSEETGLNCCPPPFGDPSQIPEFNPANYPSPIIRMRPPAHKVASNKAYLDKFEEGIRRMKSLPPSDPRNFLQQANVHCAYCDGSYRQLGERDCDFQVHSSWLFLPFHRCYLYFFERILCKLLDDYSFAMPFWNWDHPDGMRIPSIYTDQNSHLYDSLRNPNHQPPTIIDLNYHGADEQIPDKTLIEANLRYMYSNVYEQDIAYFFMGRNYEAGSKAAGEPGTFEMVPHNTVHNWTGDGQAPYGMDMGAFFAAAQDPIFYAHHSNVDRVWSIWNNKLGAKRPNWDVPDFKDAYFIFYDENANPVKIYVRDCFDTKKLGYDYEEVDILWKERRPFPPSGQTLRAKRSSSTKPVVTELKNQPLDSVIRTRVNRPPKRLVKASDNEEKVVEVLALEVELKRGDVFAKFDVYINDDFEHGPNQRTRATKEYVGSFTTLPHRPKKGHMNMVTNVKLPLTSKLTEDIIAEGDDYVDVVLVPRAGEDSIIIKKVEIEFLSSSSK